MHFTAAFLVLATGLATLVSAAPADVTVRSHLAPLSTGYPADYVSAQTNVESILEPRADRLIKYCTDVNLDGSCQTEKKVSETCSDLPSKFNDKISSLKVGGGHICCFFV
jgi:hypothetical protein